MDLSFIKFDGRLGWKLKFDISFLSISLGYFTYWLSPFSNLLSRKHEFEADSFAKDSIGSEEPLIQALRKLYKENLTHPLPHAWIAAFHFSHPTIIERKGTQGIEFNWSAAITLEQYHVWVKIADIAPKRFMAKSPIEGNRIGIKN